MWVLLSAVMPRTAGPPTPAVVFGERVRKRRRELGWSQERLADECGIHYSYVSSLERGRRNVGLAIIVRIADTLGVDPGSLIEGIRPGPGDHDA